MTLILCLVSAGYGWDPWRRGEREDVEAHKHHERGNGDAAESPEGGASHPCSVVVPWRKVQVTLLSHKLVDLWLGTCFLLS